MDCMYKMRPEEERARRVRIIECIKFFTESELRKISDLLEKRKHKWEKEHPSIDTKCPICGAELSITPVVISCPRCGYHE